jgi:hypothetical protein
LIEISDEKEEKWKFNDQLRVNWHKSKIKDQKEKNVLKFEADVEVWHGHNYIKLKVPGQSEMQLKGIKR